MAVCRFCQNEVKARLPCRPRKTTFPSGVRLEAVPHAVDLPPTLGVPLPMSFGPWNVTPWHRADAAPKAAGQVRVSIVQQRPHPQRPRQDETLYTFYPWEPEEEAEKRKAALIVEHGYRDRPIDVGDDGIAILALGMIFLETPFCGCCRTPVGSPHHIGCDMEICPLCKSQFIGCDCLDDG